MVRQKTLFVNGKREPRLLAYLLGCVFGNLAALAVNTFWMQWPVTWAVFTAATLLALYGVFSIETVVEGCVFTVIAAVPLVLVLYWRPEFHVLKQLWLSAVTGTCIGQIWVGIIR